MNPCKISNHSDKHSDNFHLWGIKNSPNELKFCEVSRNKNQRDAKISEFSLDKKKIFLKKY